MKNHLEPKKSLGQNFLIDENIARNIVRDFRPSLQDVVVEIGPGRGALTKHLAGKVGKLIAVELDRRVIEELEKTFASSGVSIIHQDFLDLRLVQIAREAGRRVRLVGNIPYHLTSAILIKAFDEREAVQDITIMVQREVAQRLAAKPGTKLYGILSVYARFYGTLKVLFTVSPNCFYPKPKISSAVIQATFFDKIPPSINEQLFRTVVRTAFGKRRKTLRNALRYLPGAEESLEAIEKITHPFFEKRPEQLSVEEYVELTNLIAPHINVYAPHTS